LSRGTAATDEIVETALGADLHIDRRRGARGEVTRRVVRRIHDSDPATAEVAEEILADIAGRELGDGRIVKGPADNGASTRGPDDMVVLK
jgi:hypothetical protein